MLGRFNLGGGTPTIKQSNIDEIINQIIKDNNIPETEREIVKITVNAVIKNLQNSKKIKIKE